MATMASAASRSDRHRQAGVTAPVLNFGKNTAIWGGLLFIASSPAQASMIRSANDEPEGALGGPQCTAGKRMKEPLRNDSLMPPILLAMTVATGMVDAVSFLALGRVFHREYDG